jgi:hypothetical protein
MWLLVLLPLRKVGGVLTPTQGYYVEEYADPVQAMYDWFTHDWESGFDRDLGFRLAGDGSVAFELTWYQLQDRLIDLGRYGIPSEAFLHYDFYVVLVDVSAWHVGRFRRLARVYGEVSGLLEEACQLALSGRMGRDWSVPGSWDEGDAGLARREYEEWLVRYQADRLVRERKGDWRFWRRVGWRLWYFVGDLRGGIYNWRWFRRGTKKIIKRWRKVNLWRFWPRSS